MLEVHSLFFCCVFPALVAPRGGVFCGFGAELAVAASVNSIEL